MDGDNRALLTTALLGAGRRLCDWCKRKRKRKRHCYDYDVLIFHFVCFPFIFFGLP
jgi:hypothetical protein